MEKIALYSAFAIYNLVALILLPFVYIGLSIFAFKRYLTFR